MEDLNGEGEKRFSVWLWDADGVRHFAQSFDTYEAAMEFAKGMKSGPWAKAAIYDGMRQGSENR